MQGIDYFCNSLVWPDVYDNYGRPLFVAQAQLDGVGVELVAGIDAAGYVLGAALASRLRVGFLAIRKGGSLPVPTDEVSYSYSKGSGKRMEMRASAFPPVRP